jgi:predicted secreted protein
MAKYSAFGTILKIGGSAGTAIANVESIDGPEMMTETIDMTAHDSSGGYREKMPTFLDAGDISLRMQFDPGGATHKDAAGGLLNAWKTKALTSFALVFPSTPAVTWTFSAYVTKFTTSAPFDDKLSADCTLTVSGAVTMA